LPIPIPARTVGIRGRVCQLGATDQGSTTTHRWIRNPRRDFWPWQISGWRWRPPRGIAGVPIRPTSQPPISSWSPTPRKDLYGAGFGFTAARPGPDQFRQFAKSGGPI